MRPIILACFLALSLSLVTAATVGLRAEDAQVQLGRYPEQDPYQEPRFPLRQSNVDTFNFGPAKSQLQRYRQPIRRYHHCPTAIDGAVCSGHGNCTRSAADVFGVSVTNSRSYVCRCFRGWHGEACELRIRGKSLAQMEKLFNSPTPKQLHKAKAPTNTDMGSAFGRFVPYNNQPVPWTPVSGKLRATFEPNSLPHLESWVNPAEASFQPGARLLARYERERLQVSLPLKKKNKFESVVAWQGNRLAVYTDKEGQSIVSPVVYRGQQGILQRDETKPLLEQPPLRDPAVQKFLDTLDQIAARTNAVGQPLLAAPR